ncbi:MAG: hypothetical protein NTZ47_00095 [Bacteroidetes bacterium]|nr:hypothetical protein [Bacteroidota bacterium]
MKSIYLILLLLCVKVVQAHEPQLSSLMIYDQNGKSLLLIKSSLTAFEGEIDYHYNKTAYRTPDEFNQLIIKHFDKNCFVIINDDTVKLINPYVILGHETTMFAELLNPPKKITSVYVRNTFFKDMHNNMCELILTTKGLPQQQYILKNDNQQEVKLRVENEKWVVDKTSNSFYKPSNLILWGIIIFIVLTIVIIANIRKKNIS